MPEPMPIWRWMPSRCRCVAEFRSHATGQDAPTQELLEAIGNSPCSGVILARQRQDNGALERLAWVIANQSLNHAADTRHAWQCRS